MRRLTMLYIMKVKTERLSQYREELESQKEGFLKEKIDKLTWMKDTEIKYRETPTVSDADIEAVLKQLQNLQVVIAKENANKCV